MKTLTHDAAHYIAQSHTIVPKKLIDLLDSTKNDALTVVQRTTTVQESPSKVVQQVVFKPQAATAHQLNADESPGKQ